MSLSTEERSVAVGAVYDHALDRGGYRFSLLFDPDEETAEVFGLATELLGMELEHRERVWAGLERFLSYVPPIAEWDEMCELPDDAIRAAWECGWYYDPPESADE